MRICIAYNQGPDDNSKAGQAIARIPNWTLETASVSAGNVCANLASSRTLLVFRPTGIELALQEATRALVEKSPSAKRQFARLMRRLFGVNSAQAGGVAGSPALSGQAGLHLPAQLEPYRQDIVDRWRHRRRAARL